MNIFNTKVIDPSNIAQVTREVFSRPVVDIDHKPLEKIVVERELHEPKHKPQQEKLNLEPTGKNG